MKNRAAIVLATLIAFMALASTRGRAQIAVIANVPFDFCAGYGVFSAGEYSIREYNSSTLMLSSSRRSLAIIMPESTDWSTRMERSKLLFHRYGDEYFLAEVWTSQDGVIRKLHVNRREKLLAKSGVPRQTAVLYATAVPKAGK